MQETTVLAFSGGYKQLPVINLPAADDDSTAQTAVDVPQRTLHFPSIGTVTLYGNTANPAAFILFLSGDGDWNRSVSDMATAIAQDGQTLVVGIGLIKYYKKLQATTEKCLYPAGDLENLSEFVQKELKIPVYHKPVLVGYSSGATLAYALLCQAPVNTFRGGIVLGFCPDIEIDKPLCEGSGKLTMTRRKDGHGFDFADHPAPGAPLEVLHGEIDKNCDCRETCAFFNNVKNVDIVRLPKVGHGFGTFKDWMPQFRQAMNRILAGSNHSTGMMPASGNCIPAAMASVGNAAAGKDDTELPVLITPAAMDASTPMVLFLSGDGGWTGFDQQICDELAARRLPTVGLNCQSYFWKKKTPEQTVADLEAVIRQYLKEWSKSKVLLVGYSFGANVAPFILNRLPADLRPKVQSAVLLSPDTKADFEVHVAGMLGKSGGPYDVAAELRSIQQTPVLCVSGDQESNEMQSALQGAAHVRFEKIPGSHHYNNDARKVVITILSKP